MELRTTNCASCPYLDVERDARGWPKRGAAGFCKLREFHVDSLEDTRCENHPEQNFLGFEAPIGPIWARGLPVVMGGIALSEEGAGLACEACGEITPGPEHIVWRNDDQRKHFCSVEHYFDWAVEKDLSLAERDEPSSEDVSEVRRFHHGLCNAEKAMQSGKEEDLEQFRTLVRFVGRGLYRYLGIKGLLPRSDVRLLWPDLFRGGSKQTRQFTNPWILEVQLALREVLLDPPETVPQDPSDRAYEYARVRWTRMVVADLLGIKEGPDVPADVDKRFRGRHRPSWKEGESDNPENARRTFYLERNPDLEKDLDGYFGAVQSADEL